MNNIKQLLVIGKSENWSLIIPFLCPFPNKDKSMTRLITCLKTFYLLLTSLITKKFLKKFTKKLNNIQYLNLCLGLTKL